MHEGDATASSAPPTGRPVALVTGASRGIGKAVAVDLAAAGFDVAVAARTRTDGHGRLDDDPTVVVPGGLDTTLALIEEQGVVGLALTMDLLDRGSVLGAAEAVLDRFGRADVLVNNAIHQGPGVMALFADLSEAQLRTMFEGNVYAQLALVRALLPKMLEQGGGTVVNLISGTAYLDPPARVGEGGWGLGYAMTKAAFARVAPLLHVEYGDEGLRAFSVDPGFVVTERMEAARRTEQYRRHFAAATPEVIGRAVRWLATDPDADELCGRVVMAQAEVQRRTLLPGWPPTEAACP
jgi:NAD(P)-dependent dehydrogenase (short-subunit alcohol dehydrogenase family)